ncbi:MAG: hypothetical protein KGL69_06605 [Alphaproteobacteria bacterium]|nr:hypothetical protein [Alphaproteobacteria bacterium]
MGLVVTVGIGEERDLARFSQDGAHRVLALEPAYLVAAKARARLGRRGPVRVMAARVGTGRAGEIRLDRILRLMGAPSVSYLSIASGLDACAVLESLGALHVRVEAGVCRTPGVTVPGQPAPVVYRDVAGWLVSFGYRILAVPTTGGEAADIYFRRR